MGKSTGLIGKIQTAFNKAKDNSANKKMAKVESIDDNKRLNRIVERRYVKMDKKYERAAGNEKKMAKVDKKYGYNYEGAKAAGIVKDETGYMGSIGNEGLILKGKKHPSMIKTRKVEKLLGNKIVRKGGNLYTVPKKS
jgi:hypothetical protein